MVNTPKPFKKYGPLWDCIKQTGAALIEIEGAVTMTSKQRQKAFETIRKAVVKSKYEDFAYKRAFPRMQLEIVQLEDYHKVMFKLEYKKSLDEIF